jgi:membrane protein YqaA with SNARE-associated domain
MALARPERAWHYAFICTITSVLGGIVGYTIGYLLYDTVGKALISFYGYGARIEELRLLYAEWGHLVILIKGMTPIPYKLVTIASGIFHYDLFWFVTLSIFTRGVRFFAIAALIHFYGPSIRDFIEKRLGLVTALIALSLVGGFAIVKFAL